jgi:hypothetical protein
MTAAQIATLYAPHLPQLRAEFRGYRVASGMSARDFNLACAVHMTAAGITGRDGTPDEWCFAAMDVAKECEARAAAARMAAEARIEAESEAWASQYDF